MSRMLVAIPHAPDDPTIPRDALPDLARLARMEEAAPDMLQALKAVHAFLRAPVKAATEGGHLLITYRLPIGGYVKLVDPIVRVVDAVEAPLLTAA